MDLRFSHICVLHAQCLRFGVLTDLGTILGRRGAQERPLSSPAVDFYRFVGAFRDHILEVVWYLGRKKNMLCVLVPRPFFLIFFGYEFGCVEFGMRRIAKIDFHGNLNYKDVVLFFWDPGWLSCAVLASVHSVHSHCMILSTETIVY